MKNFIDFVVDAAKDAELGKEFAKHVEGSDHKTMSAWLSKKGYHVHADECKKIVENKDDLKNNTLGFSY